MSFPFLFAVMSVKFPPLAYAPASGTNLAYPDDYISSILFLGEVMAHRIWQSTDPQMQALLSTGAVLFEGENSFVVLSIIEHKGEMCGFIHNIFPTQEIIQTAIDWQKGNQLPKLLSFAYSFADREAFTNFGFSTSVEAALISIKERPYTQTAANLSVRPTSQPSEPTSPKESPSQRGRKTPRREGSGGNPSQSSGQASHHSDSSPEEGSGSSFLSDFTEGGLGREEQQAS